MCYYIYIWIQHFENGCVWNTCVWMGSCLVYMLGCLRGERLQHPRTPICPGPQRSWVLTFREQRAHGVAGRLGLLHSVYKHTHSHTHAQWSDEWYVRKRQHVCATHSHTHGWLEGKSSCRLSMTSNKRTIENNKTGSHSGSSRKSFPLLLKATSQHRAIQTPDPLSSAKLVFTRVHCTLKRRLLDTGVGKLTTDFGVLTYNLFWHISQQYSVS